MMHFCLEIAFVAILHYTNAVSINYAGNNLTMLPNNLSLYNNAVEIHFENNILSTIPTNKLYGLPDATHIFFQENQINKIFDGAFSQMGNVTFVNLSYNDLTSIGNMTLYGLTSIQDLNLTKNQITEISDFSFSWMWNLTFLHLAFNELSILTNATFHGLGNLRFLNISFNKFIEYPAGVFSPLTSLSSLDIQENYPEEIRAEFFVGIEHVEHIYLGSPHHKSFEDYAFSKLSNLETLHFFDSQIEVIEENDLKGLFKLRYLQASWNSLKHVEDGAFSDLGNLFEFHTYENKMEGLSPNVFNMSNHPSFLWLMIDRSRFQCDARQCWMLEPENNWIRPLRVECIGPPCHRGRDWGSITKSDLGCDGQGVPQAISEVKIGQTLSDSAHCVISDGDNNTCADMETNECGSFLDVTLVVNTNETATLNVKVITREWPCTGETIVMWRNYNTLFSVCSLKMWVTRDHLHTCMYQCNTAGEQVTSIKLRFSMRREAGQLCEVQLS